jgi:integrase
MYSLINVRPSLDLICLDEVCREYGLQMTNDRAQWLMRLPLVGIVLDSDGNIHWDSTLFLADIALTGRSLTGDTVRSYGYSLVSWLNYLESHKLKISDVTEQDLQLFRNHVWSKVARPERSDLRASKSTVIARVETARRFHDWGARTRRFESLLGLWAQANSSGTKRSNNGWSSRCSSRRIALPSEQRLPKILSANELKKLVSAAPEPYSLVFKWAVTTGLRRVELCRLNKDVLNGISFSGNNRKIMQLDVLRKGGRLVSTYLPAALMNDTSWYMKIGRAQPKHGMDDAVFLTKNGCRLQREHVSRVFRECADSVGSKATMHHLRHTFAVTVLQILQHQVSAGSEINPLKTLQVLMGHATLASTEIYLRALDVYSDEVAEALDFLYGASI